MLPFETPPYFFVPGAPRQLQRGLVCVGQRRGGAGADLAQVRDHAEVAPSSHSSGFAWLSVFVALQRVVHGPAFGALQPADQLALASKFRNPLWALRLAAK